MPPASLNPAEPALLAGRLLRWYRRHRRDLPWRRRSDPYSVWIAEMMLQQTTVKAVVPYYRRFMRRFPDVETLSRARLSSVLAAWSGLGYYSRARHLHAAARLIRRRHGGILPSSLPELLALPGIGRYSAGAILSIAFGQPQPILDGNVARVLSRLLGRRGDPRTPRNSRRLWSVAAQLVRCSSSPGDLNQSLMELGATLCTPASPDCPRCPVRVACAAFRDGTREVIPPPRRRRAPIAVELALAVIEKEGRILMRRRNGTSQMDGMWDLPAFPSRGDRSQELHPGPPLRMRRLARIARLRHAITYRRIEVDVFRAELLREPRGSEYRWLPLSRARRVPHSALVGKILVRIDD